MLVLVTEALLHPQAPDVHAYIAHLQPHPFHLQDLSNQSQLLPEDIWQVQTHQVSEG